MTRRYRPSTSASRTKAAAQRSARVRLCPALLATIVVTLGIGLSACGAPAAASSAPASPSPLASLVASMPNVVGMTAQNAANTLTTQAGISTVYVNGGTASANLTVTAQWPVPGTSITSSTRVELAVQQASSPETSTTTSAEATTTEPAPSYPSNTDSDPYVPIPDAPHVDAPSDSSHVCVKNDKNGRWRDSHGRFCSP